MPAKAVVAASVAASGGTAFNALQSEDLTAGGVLVKYVGSHSFVDRLYGSKLPFEPGQIRELPALLAEKLLRHADVFERGAALLTEAKPAKLKDDTQALLTEAKKDQAKEDVISNQRQDLVDQVNVMDKDALKDFAQEKYGQPLSKSLSLENMRNRVTGFIDQYGMV